MSDGPSSENVAENNASMANNGGELHSQGSIDKRIKDMSLSIVSNITKKIRLKLPNAASYLKRLMRLKNGGKLESEREMIDGASEVSEITEMSINEQDIPADRDSVDWSESHVVETRWYETPSDPSNPEGPSTSTVHTDDNTSEYPAIATVAQTQPVQTISNSVTTTEAMTTNGIFVSVLNRDAAAARNILQFREALSSQIGSQAERLRDQETRSVPLVYIQSEDRHELYLQSTVNGESGFSGSSTIGSEISSMSGNDHLEVRNQRIGQDVTPQFFSGMLSVDRVIRKPICRNDDEPTIY
ncbi:uncharacterized protein LOC100645074 [Bombus terrestris]|uniref:Uncharacterized protein LOC100645074 n=1 Tax=Bombus terrestris TaxID=30195 RepID=A0A9C6W790_BOMTE|nr:uncharacterized protein LOC100645074 [Bombus terrestris]